MPNNAATLRSPGHQDCHYLDQALPVFLSALHLPTHETTMSTQLDRDASGQSRPFSQTV
jgi:hypothetical protein